MKKNSTRKGQQGPTSAQHSGTENKGDTFITGRGTQNQHNPAAQQSKFNTLSAPGDKSDSDRTFDSDSTLQEPGDTKGKCEIQEADVEDIDNDIEQES